MTKEEAILEVLHCMDANELVAVNNRYLEQLEYWDDLIYYTDDMDDLFYNKGAFEILTSAYYGCYNPNADYFKFNGYGNILSINSYELADYIDFKDIIYYCLEHQDALECDAIQAILDGKGVQ